MRILLGYESSGVAREAFRRRGHEVWSCDLQPADDGSPWHLQCDVWGVVDGPWDFAIFHPDCTYLTGSAEWAYGDGPYHQNVKPGTLVGAPRREARERSIDEVRRLMALPYRKVIENPVGVLSSRIRKPEQIIQPHQFGHDASKKTCLWLDRTPPLLIDPAQRFPGRVVEWPRGSGKMVERWGNQTDSGQNRLTPGEHRWKDRARTYDGIGEAFAINWG